MGHTWQPPIKFLPSIFWSYAQNFHPTPWKGRIPPMLKVPHYIPISGKNVNEIAKIEYFVDSNLNLIIKVFTWGLANDREIYNNMKNLQNISPVWFSQINKLVCYYHVTYAFQREPTLYSCLSIKELLTRNRRDIWSLSGSSNGIRTPNHLLCELTTNHLAKLAKLDNLGSLAKLLSIYLRTKWLWVRIPLLSL